MSVVAAAMVVLAAAAIAFVWTSTKPPRPRAGEATMDLGPESPAVVDLLTGGFRVEDDAVPATVVDLGARGWLDIDEAGGRIFLRRRSGKGDLTKYEERVLRHIEGHAIDGQTPAEVLTIGPKGVSGRWWKGFVREVTREARDLGLARRRIDLKHLAMMWVPVFVAWGVINLLGEIARDEPPEGGWGGGTAMVLSLSFVAMVLLSAVAMRISRSDAQAATDEGLEAAGRWLGVRHQLRESGSFERASAASVAVWDRYLAYATAMGLAPVVQRQLPFESEHDRQAWSRVTGTWRRVRVRYLALRPGWGVAPWTVALTGAIQAAVYGVVAWAGLMLAREEIDLTSLPEGPQRWLPAVGLGVFAVAAAAAAFALLKVVLGALDLFPRRIIEGEVVRHRELPTGHRLPNVVQRVMWSGRDQHGMDRRYRRRVRYHVAIDDGSRDSVVAYQVRPQLFRTVRQGSTVRARVTPLLGYVSELTELSPPQRGGEAPVAHELVEDLLGKAATHAGGLAGALDQRLDAAGPEARAAMEQALDERGDDGRTHREQLADASAELERARRSGRIPDLAGSAGGSLIGGIIGNLSKSLEQLAGRDTDDPDDEGEPPPPG